MRYIWLKLFWEGTNYNSQPWRHRSRATMLLVTTQRFEPCGYIASICKPAILCHSHRRIRSSNCGVFTSSIVALYSGGVIVGLSVYMWHTCVYNALNKDCMVLLFILLNKELGQSCSRLNPDKRCKDCQSVARDVTSKRSSFSAPAKNFNIIYFYYFFFCIFDSHQFCDNHCAGITYFIFQNWKKPPLK